MPSPRPHTSWTCTMLSAMRLMARPQGLRVLVRGPTVARPLVARMSTVPTTLRNREEPQAETNRRGLASGAVSTVSAEKDTALEVRPIESQDRRGQAAALAWRVFLAAARGIWPGARVVAAGCHGERCKLLGSSLAVRW